MKKVQELVSNEAINYLFPFFWQHGESDEVIIDYMNQMMSKGIKAACIESRPHPDFLGDGWWKTMDTIVNYAKQIGMKLWILDDAKFPTGYANGQVPKHLKKVYLDIRKFDVVGPAKQVQLNLNFISGRSGLGNRDPEAFYEVKSISLVRKNDDVQSFDEDSLIDLTQQSDGHLLTMDVPKGHFSVYVVFKTNMRGENQTKDYLNPLDKNATQILINEVYETHYHHYKEHFGDTIVGFFSDEPRFGNARGFNSIIGRSDMVLPYVEGIESLLQTQIHDFSINDWMYAFVGSSDRANHIRQVYMDVVSSLYRDHFSKLIGQWCKDHGVDYTGHTIEDNNAHARLGYGAGHYFRGIEGQSITGIDIIGGQVVPGMDYHHDAFSTGGSDGEFYHYALCKLGASSAKLDKNKNGTLMCEAFGAYGWSLGLKMMKWITDHMISRGVNLIVPHAFSPKEFPDWDCPPHFYAHGHNPQFEYFESWSNYANRLCHLFTGGTNVTSIGVLYHAFGEWAGDSMLIQKPLKHLAQHQIDSNIISEDYLLNCHIQDGHYWINGYAYDVLIVPYTQRMTESIAKKLIELVDSGIQVIILDAFPETVLQSQLLSELVSLIVCVPLEKLSAYIQQHAHIDMIAENDVPYLSAYHYSHEDGDAYMLFNESIQESISTWVHLKKVKHLSVYDAMTNQLKSIKQRPTDDGLSVYITLQPYESVVLVSEETNVWVEVEKKLHYDISDDWQVDLIPYTSKETNETIHLSKLDYITDKFPDFSGKLVYRKKINLEYRQVDVHIEEAVEVVAVYLNGTHCGTKIAPPYHFELSDAVKNGENTLEIHVVNTLGRSQKEFFSHYLVLEPLGMKSVSLAVKS